LIIYADSSFLVSCLCSFDTGHGAARAFFSTHIADDWVTSNWSQFETVNSLRQLRRSNPKLPAELPEGLRRLFKKWHERGNFSLERTDSDEAINEAAQISAAFGRSFRARSADVLHIALLEQINPDLFVTRDKEQFALARARGFAAQLIQP
jgi:predicted nucleic acid-binding protein